MIMDTSSRRKELGAFLHALRERCAPEAFGFPLGSRRRTPGLRREEVAQLAGISPTWYTWIEQGRDVKVSAEVLLCLAQALQLTPSQRTYLFELAGQGDPHDLLPPDDSLPPVLDALLADISVPAYIMGRTWDVLAWNAAAADLFAGWLPPMVTSDPVANSGALQAQQTVALADDLPGPPNLLRFVFTHALARTLVVDWEVRARRLCAEFRADCRLRLEESGLQRLVSELQQASSEFARYWQQHDVLERQGGERRFQHSRHGLLCFRQVTLLPVEQESLKLVLLKPQ